MIAVLFEYGSELVEIRLDNSNCYFRTHNQFGGNFTTIENLRLDKAGVIKEHPDLKQNDDWRDIAIKRFKDKLKSFKSNNQRMDYIIEDLKKFGYIPIWKQVSGHRVQRIRQKGDSL